MTYATTRLPRRNLFVPTNVDGVTEISVGEALGVVGPGPRPFINGMIVGATLAVFACILAFSVLA
ncbi:hypothetical protein J2D73_20095 [Acetobacter sacchari]|uniref:Uncharacterized protein n=1 Tax=Acetobacter sacchari TaxID=2661687 RepID=A0ABS3M1S3_9PROT|nr:hypothetical protein [Acetobacter sacchari]MBO1362082.1 hypothetical protein [Acetobacter sacchari]